MKLIEQTSVPVSPNQQIYRTSDRSRCDERRIWKFLKGLRDLLLAVHHECTIPRNRLTKRLAQDEQKTHAGLDGYNIDPITAVHSEKVTYNWVSAAGADSPPHPV